MTVLVAAAAVASLVTPAAAALALLGVPGPVTPWSRAQVHSWHYRLVASTDLDRLARTAYDAHRAAHPGSLPSWEDVSDQEKKAWRAAISAVTGSGESTLTEAPAAHAIIVQAGDQTRTFHAEFTAGRQGSLVINDEHASSHHALFQLAHGYWFVQDLGSTNGTWLNNRRMYAAQRLKKGDKIKIGRTIVVVVSTT